MEQQSLLALKIGSLIQLQPVLPENAPRYGVRLIGYLPGGSLIVSTPVVKGKVQIVRAGQRFTVRMLQGSSVVAFVAQVLESVLRPYPHLHLEYPQAVEQTVVRSSERVVAAVSARARNMQHPDTDENFRDVTIVDLGVGGAKLAATLPLGATGDTLQLEFVLEVLGELERLVLLAEIRSLVERLDEVDGRRGLTHLLGVQFRQANRFQQVLIHAWVSEYLAGGLD